MLRPRGCALREEIQVNTEFDDALREAYAQQGVATAEGGPVHLPTGCPNAARCWAGKAELAPRAGHADGQVSPPWIGSAYYPGGLALLVDDVGSIGGLDFERGGLRRRVESIRARLLDGKGGRPPAAWARLLSYAAAWFESQGAQVERWRGGYSPAGLVEVLEHVAVVAQVKCANSGRASPASQLMWTRCLGQVTGPELSAISPRRVIAIGESRAVAALRSHMPHRVSPPIVAAVGRGRRRVEVVRERRYHPDLATLDLLFVPHPGRRSGKADGILDAARSVLSQKL